MKAQWLQRQKSLRNWRNAIWEGDGSKSGQRGYIDWHFDFLEKFYTKPDSRNANLLDVGCGYMLRNFDQAGRLTELFDLIGCRYSGIDPMTDWFNTGRRLGLELYEGVGEDLPFERDTFHRALCLGVIDHVMRPNRVLLEINRVLKAGGSLWFACPFIEGPWPYVVKEKFLHRCGFDESHLFVWTPGQLERLVERNGFKVCRTQFCSTTTSFYIEAIKI